MSSHHIIRDAQEPALIIHRLDRFPLSILDSLLEWSPTVISGEVAIESYLKLGYKLDVAVVSFGNLNEWKVKLEEQQPIAFLAAREGCFFSESFLWLKGSGHAAASIITTEAAFEEVVSSCREWFTVLDLVIFTETKRSIICRTPTFRKWLSENTVLYVKLLTNGSKFSSSGLEHDLTDQLIMAETEIRTKGEGELHIHCDNSPFMLRELI